MVPRHCGEGPYCECERPHAHQGKFEIGHEHIEGHAYLDPLDKDELYWQLYWSIVDIKQRQATERGEA